MVQMPGRDELYPYTMRRKLFMPGNDSLLIKCLSILTAVL